MNGTLQRIIALSALLLVSLNTRAETVAGIERTEHRIALPDGVHLAVDLYRPANRAAEQRLPVLLEYLPYRKAESRARNLALYAYFVRAGYAVARVDIRGTGESEGITIPYEYSDIELDDGEIVIDWLATQPWSSGAVGMFGISWGGFNAIQLALRAPPALKAYVALMATDYLYAEDVHYIDGIMHTDSWMMSHDLYNAMPGAPAFTLDERWVTERFEREPSVFTYLRQQRDGPFWDRASARGQYQRLTVPGFHIGGWYDGYRNSLLRQLEHAAAPSKAMIGPWDHYFPHNAWPGPAMEWRREAVRWFDQFLRGRQTGILEEPRFAVYIRDHHAPDPSIATVPGRWRWEDGWPLARTDWQTWHLNGDGALARQAGSEAVHELDYVASVGLEGGGPTMWWGSVAPDQQPMDDESLVYDSHPLAAALEILGRPRVHLPASASATRGNWVVRISDVAPDGTVTQVAGAALNGTHRNSARRPEAIIPGEQMQLALALHFTSWTFPPGHRIRVAISHSQWPMLWPTREPFRSRLTVGGDQGARLSLPVIPAGPERRPEFASPAGDPELPGFATLDAGNVTGYAALNAIDRDPLTGRARGVARNSGGTRYPWGTERFEETLEHQTSDRNPAQSQVLGSYALSQNLNDGRTLRFEQTVRLRSDWDNFHLRFERRAYLNGTLFREKLWEESIPRDFQ